MRRGQTALVVIVAAALHLIATRNGVSFTPDSWGYWEGSVSLLEGCGYKFLNGPSITDWPPLTSQYLAAVQALLGVSIRVVDVALMVAFVIGAVGTWQLTRTLANGSPGLVMMLGAVSASLLLLPWYGVLFSESLTLALLPWLLRELVIVIGAGAIHVWVALRMTVFLTILMLARHASLAVVGATAAALFWGTRHSVQNVARAAVIAVVPLMVWWLAAQTSGVATTQRLEGEATLARVLALATPLAVALGTMLATSRGGLNWLALASTSVVLLLAARALFQDTTTRRGVAGLALFAMVGSLATVVLYAAAAPYDTLFARFVLFAAVPLILAVSSVAAGTTGTVRWLARAALVLIFVSQCARAGKVLWQGQADSWGPVLPLTATISGRTEPRDRQIALPDWPWVQRSAPGTGCQARDQNRSTVVRAGSVSAN